MQCAKIPKNEDVQWRTFQISKVLHMGSMSCNPSSIKKSVYFRNVAVSFVVAIGFHETRHSAGRKPETHIGRTSIECAAIAFYSMKPR